MEMIRNNRIGHSHIDCATFNEANLHQWCHLMNGAFFRLIDWLNLENLGELLSYIRDREIKANGTFSEADIRCMTFHATHYSDRQVLNFQINPVKHVICILHTEIISRLLLRCKTERRLSQFVRSSLLLTLAGININVDVPLAITDSFDFIDKHFYLDMLIQRLHKPIQNLLTFRTIQDKISRATKNNLLFGIAHYVYPYHWQFWKNQVDENKKVKVTFGIHPHVAARGISNRQQQQLSQYIHNNNQCIAVGETGLNFTTECYCVKKGRHCHSPQNCMERIRANQEEAFLIHLKIAARENLPVVLHCRDNGNGSAAARVLQIILHHGYSNLAFHRHCFFGNVEELDEWKRLPRIKFGVTGKIVNLQDVKANNVAARIPDHQLLLETDAPYLSPVPGAKINHPWNLIDIAEFMSKLRNTPLPFLIEMTNKNAREFYRL